MERKKPAHLRRMPGINLDKLIESAGRGVDSFSRTEGRKPKVSLVSQEKVLEGENDLSMLVVNERQYTGAVNSNQAILRIVRMMSAWGAGEELLWDTVKSQSKNSNMSGAEMIRALAPSANALFRGDSAKVKIFRANMDVLIRSKTNYVDELDEFIMQNPELLGTFSIADSLGEQLRSKGETLSLIRMQIDFLKRKQREERAQRQTPKKVQATVIKTEPETLPDETLPAGEGITEQTQAEREPLQRQEPFGLAGWKVYWTDAKFSDNPNQLVEMPTDSKDAFVSKLEEINAGKKAFQIKTGSVASCIEMWAVPEFRRRAMLSRFKWGPSYVRDWSKLVRGPVRIMVNSDEAEKRLVFFAADRDTVYRGVFAGMSS